MHIYICVYYNICMCVYIYVYVNICIHVSMNIHIKNFKNFYNVVQVLNINISCRNFNHK